MTGIAGIFGPEEANPTFKLETLLSAMESRGSIKQSASIKGEDGIVNIGSCSHPGQESSTTNAEKTSTIIDGTLPENLELEEIGGEANTEALAETVQVPGAFAILAISGGRLLALRDVVGQKPLYYGEDMNGTVAFASLTKALTKIGITNINPVKPGQLVAVSKRGSSIVADRSLTRPKEIRVSEHDASTRLHELLADSLGDGVPKDSALAFSGGLDSTLEAQAAMENGLRPELITVGLKGQPELDHARTVSKQLGLDLTVRELSASEVLDSLPDVVQTIESSDPTLVGVSVPLYFVCEVAEEMGMGCILAGQLSDELFAGYGRFDKLAAKKKHRQAREEVWSSVLAASGNDFEPGDKLAVSHRLELRCPFAFLPLVEYALGLPISLKLRLVGSKVVRKHILRRLASDWKLPETVVNRPKKAVQYSSGVQKILLKEAKRRKMTLRSLLESLYQNW